MFTKAIDTILDNTTERYVLFVSNDEKNPIETFITSSNDRNALMKEGEKCSADYYTVLDNLTKEACVQGRSGNTRNT